MAGAGGVDHRPSTRVLSIPKEGERIIAPTRRPDGTLRKPVRIRAGYTPQDEVAIYQPKGALLRRSQPELPPGYDDPVVDARPKTKSAKRNERKKEKRHQAALAASVDDKGKNLDSEQAEVEKANEISSCENNRLRTEAVESITDQMNCVSISGSAAAPADLAESSNPFSSGLDINKSIRALKKKVRLAESKLQGEPEINNPEQLEKMKKIEGWLVELKSLESQKAALL